MNAAEWFYRQSFCGRDDRPKHIVCTARGRDGGAYIVSFFGSDAAAKADAFRVEQEGYGCTVTTEEVR